MSISRIWSNFTTRAVKYEDGHITNPKQADAFKATRDLEKAASAVAAEMLTHDNGPDDFNPKLVNDVYLDGGKTPYAGHCVKSNDGSGVTRLEATTADKTESFSISVSGDRKEIRHRKEIEGKAGDAPLDEEQWAIFDGSKVKYKAVSY